MPKFAHWAHSFHYDYEQKIWKKENSLINEM